MSTCTLTQALLKCEFYMSFLFLLVGNMASLAPKRELAPRVYNVLMRIYDVGMLYQDSTLVVEVCQCRGAVSSCSIPYSAPRLLTSSLATSVLGAIFGLLCM